MNFAYWVPVAGLAGLSAIAGWLDATQRRIPNWLCALAAGLGLLAAAILGGWSALGSHALHMAVALCGGLVLYALRGIGGGDAKFYAGVAAWFSLGQGALLLCSVALAGLVLLVLWFTYRRIKRLPIKRTKDTLADSLPYGLAIGAGAIVAAAV